MKRIAQLLLLLTLVAVMATAAMAGSNYSLGPSTLGGETKWTLVNDGEALKTYPDLREYVWVGARPPYGPYDKIDLRRIVKAGNTNPAGVVFFLPGTNSNTERFLIDDHKFPYAGREEKYNFFSYLANRGFDVYGISYRTHYIPWNVEGEALKFMADWGIDTFMTDIHEAVALAKKTSGVEKIWLGGHSFGGSSTMNYAARYWKEDLKGMYLLDGGTVSPAKHTNKYDLPAEIQKGLESGALFKERDPIYRNIYAIKYMGENWDALPIDPFTGKPLEPQINPKTGKPCATIKEWYAVANTDSGKSNFLGGLGNVERTLTAKGFRDRWWPARLGLDQAAMNDWENCPYLEFDYEDHYSEIDVPVVAFTRAYSAPLPTPWKPIVANKDATQYFLFGYGHDDVCALGEYTAQDVYQRLIDWLLKH